MITKIASEYDNKIGFLPTRHKFLSSTGYCVLHKHGIHTYLHIF